MNLNDLEGRVDGGRLHLSAPLVDVNGADTHRFTVDGPAELVRSVLGESDFEVTLRPGATADDWRQQVTEMVQDVPDGRSRLDPGAAFKPSPASPNLANTVLVAVEKQRPSGTTVGLQLPFALGPGVVMLVVLPFACSAAAATIPTGGDPDLFMDLAPFGPTVSSSTLGGTAVDFVSHRLPLCLPWAGFVPFCRVVGYTATVGTFVSTSYLFP